MRLYGCEKWRWTWYHWTFWVIQQTMMKTESALNRPFYRLSWILILLRLQKKLSFQDKCGTAWNMTCLWNWLKVVLRLIIKPGLTSSMLFLNKELRFFTINYVKITLFMMLSYQGKTKVRRYSFLVLGIF